MKTISYLLLALAGLIAPAWAQIPGTPASMVITLEPRHGKEIAPIDSQDLTVMQQKEKRPITNFMSAGQNGKTLQLLLLIDNSSRSSFDTEIGTLQQFVRGLQPDVEIGVGYMRNGIDDVAVNFTRDHDAAAKAIRLTLGPGGADVSPYDSLSDAVKKWPPGAERREVIMISSGSEGLGGGYAPDNPYVNRGISDAQKAGIIVFTIYNPGAGRSGRSLWRENWGQSFLSQLSDETGGEAYINGFGSPVSFQPYLQEISERLAHQYILTFGAKPQNKSDLQAVKVRVTEKDASIAAADKVFVRAGL